jgi:putative peptidoglycan lipid II flippase
LRKSGVYNPASNWAGLWLRYGAANLLMVAVVFGFLTFWNLWSEWGVMERVLRLAIVCVAGFTAYIAGLFAVGLRLRDFKGSH